MCPKWSILILTQPSRTTFLARLKEVLLPQLTDQIELCERIFDKSMTLGANRDAMIRAAQGEYVNFIDDDDLVAPNYVERILPLLDGVDYIGFHLQLYYGTTPQKPTKHSLECGKWWDDDAGYYRDISHLNPIRRELALMAPIEGGFGEDCRWADALRVLGAVKTEHFIDEVMYHYYYRPDKTD